MTLLKDIHNIYKNFPLEEKFLARIVKRIAIADKDEDFSKDDSLRMQILKRFVRHTNYHTKVVELRVLDSVSPAEKARYETLCDDEKKDFLIEHLTKDIFTPLKIKPKDYLMPDLVELTELLAENVHENWSKQKIAQGWQFGENLDDKLKTTPLLVPYADLTDDDKFYDRQTAMSMRCKFLSALIIGDL